MLITDKFVYVHQPKTGGTFVTDVLLRVHNVPENPTKIGTRTKLAYHTRYGPLIIQGPKHNSCADIPEEHREKPVLATLRHPFDRYVSSYEFGWWKKREYWEDYRQRIPGLEEQYPEFPEIGFPEYLRFVNRTRVCEQKDIGAQTVAFIRQYFRTPERVLAELDEDYFPSGRYRADMFDVRFLRTALLNQDLYDFLLGAGYVADDIGFILRLGKTLPPVPPEGKERVDHHAWRRYYSPALVEFVKHRERHLLALFPEFDQVMEPLGGGTGEAAV